MTVCSIPQCEKSAKARGWCNQHYEHWRKYGQPETKASMTVEDRFWSRVDKDGPIPEYAPHLGPCWIWSGKPKNSGYGQINVDGRPVNTHRFAYLLVKGNVGAGLVLDHLCRVRLCVNPQHLEPVSNWENILRGDSPAGRILETGLCKNGHDMTDLSNIYHAPSRPRNNRCKACNRESQRERKRRLRVKAT